MSEIRFRKLLHEDGSMKGIQTHKGTTNDEIVAVFMATAIQLRMKGLNPEIILKNLLYRWSEGIIEEVKPEDLV